MPCSGVITDQPGACLGSRAWANRAVTQLHTKSEVRVKCNTSMHQAITGKLCLTTTALAVYYS